MPLQLDVVGVSGANEYSVKPLALVSTVAPPIVAVFRLPAVAAAGLLLLAGVLLLPPVADVADELHAARTAAAAATASSASSIRRRFGPLVIRCALSPLPRRVVMTSCPLCRVCQCLSGQMGWVEMIAWSGRPGSASSIRRQCDAFSLEIDILICSSLSFLLGNWHQRQTRKLC